MSNHKKIKHKSNKDRKNCIFNPYPVIKPKVTDPAEPNDSEQNKTSKKVPLKRKQTPGKC